MGHTVGEQGGEFVIFGLYVIDDGNLERLAGRDDEYRSAGGGGVEQVDGRLGHTGCQGGGAVGLCLDEHRVQTGRGLVAGLCTFNAFLAVAAAVIDGKNFGQGSAGAGEIGPERASRHGAVEVQRTLGGQAFEADGTHEDAGIGIYIRTGSGCIHGGIDLHVEGRQGVTEVEFDLVAEFGFDNVDVRSTGSHVVVVAVNRGGHAVLGYTPAQVYALAGIHVHDVFDDRVATDAVARKGRDAGGVVAGNHTVGRRNLYIRGVCEEGQAIHLFTGGCCTELVGPVLDGGIDPDCVSGVVGHLFIVHKAGTGNARIRFIGRIVGKHTEAGGRRLQTGRREFSGYAGFAGYAPVKVGVEIDCLVLIRRIVLGFVFQTAGSSHCNCYCQNK